MADISKIQISAKSTSALELLHESDLARFYYHENFEIHMLDFQTYSSFKDESVSYKEWLIGSPPDNVITLDFSKRSDSFFEFTSGNDAYYVLWFYPGLVGEPPVIKFESGYNPSVIAGSMGEFLCRLIIDIDTELATYAPPTFFDFKTKALLKDYANIKKRVNTEMECSVDNSHKEQMIRHPILAAPITYEKVTADLKGESIMKLIGLPLESNKVLSTLFELGYEIPLHAPKDRDFDTGDSKGILLDFEPKNYDEGLYLESIEFYTSYGFLPYGIEEKDDLATVERKIGKKANYIDADTDEDSAPILYWNYKDLGYLWIEFDDSNYNSVWSIVVGEFIDFEEDPDWGEAFAPFER